jgi:lipopolysaccharide/colanic/teichoic acid biosynthesis glycosyltransferase
MDQNTVVSMKINASTHQADIRSSYLLGNTKRMIDIICSIIGLLISALPVLLAMIIIKLVDHVPPVYRQERFGIKGKPFGMYKLKTLRIVETEKTVTPEIMSRKPHTRPLTRTGAFWRKTSIDEMPQFWNVLKGEMSMVGHRPFPYYYTYRLKELDISDDELDRYLTIISSYKPGLIGYSSVHGRGKLTFKEKMVYDELYASRASLRLDLIILLRAVYATLTANGAW